MLFLDSSDPREVRELFRWGVLSGVTTNPLILARESADVELEERVLELLAVSHGPLSVELVAEDEDEMHLEADRYVAYAAHGGAESRICVKVPFSEAGLRVTRRLSDRGLSTNVTCVMSFAQAYLACLGGARYVSIFMGRIRDMGYDACEVVREARAQIDREGLPTKLIAGSIRHMRDVTDALGAGAHVVTVPPPILRKMLHNPKTDETIREFNDAWRHRKKG
jgi:transaldolase